MEKTEAEKKNEIKEKEGKENELGFTLTVHLETDIFV